MNKKVLIGLMTVGAIGFLSFKKDKTTQPLIAEQLRVENVKAVKAVARVKISKRIERIVEEKNIKLIKFEKLRKKALLTQDEKLKLDAYFTYSKNIRLAYLTLRSENFRDLDKSIDKRINATNFLVEGIKRKSADRTELIKATEMFLLSDNEENTNDLEIRRAIIGDKVELFHALSKFAPEEVKKFKENYMSERLKKVIKYVEINMERTRGRNEG